MDLNYINMEKENIDFNTTSSGAAGTCSSDAAVTVAPEPSKLLRDSAGSSPESCLLENLIIMSTESLAGSTRLSTSSLDTLVEETLLSPGDSGEAMEASSNPRETQTDEVQHTASAGAPHQEQEGKLRLTERSNDRNQNVYRAQPDEENERQWPKHLARVDQREQRAQQAHCQLVPSLLNGPLTQEILLKR